ncbi:hypothetical protein C9R18_26610 [Salmonella enterica subsp. enterica serovar Enteritidis]|nr:hypothetical protein [Salmonella enterica subsp. enterica serovar Enteritidis]
MANAIVMDSGWQAAISSPILAAAWARHGFLMTVASRRHRNDGMLDVRAEIASLQNCAAD